MFRPMRRPKNAIPDEQAKKLLREEKRGVIAMNGDDGYPFAIPVDYFYDETAGKIYFHAAKSGYKVDALRRCDKVCFTVYGGEFYKNGHWAPYVQSVLVYGRCPSGGGHRRDRSSRAGARDEVLSERRGGRSGDCEGSARCAAL